MEFVWLILTAFIAVTFVTLTVFAIGEIVYILASIIKYVKEKMHEH